MKIRSRTTLFIVAALIAVLGWSITTAAAQGDGEEEAPAAQAAEGQAANSFRAAKSARLAENPDLAKVSTHLLRAQELTEGGATEAEVLAQVPSAAPEFGLVQLDLTVSNLGDPSVKASLQAAGLTIDVASDDFGKVSGRAPLSSLEALAAIPDVEVIHPEYGFTTNVGDTTSQADSSIEADVARSTFGVDGSGVSVGIISDSFRTGDASLGGSVSGSGCSATATGMVNQLSGDLPSGVVVLDDTDPGIDEGAAMAELIHDLAPGADLMFHTSTSSETGFAAAIDSLVACGADVIVDDIIFFAEPFFQDGIIAQAATNAVAAGIPYFSSGGNRGTFGINDIYSDSAGTSNVVDGDDFHDFNPGGGVDTFAAIDLDPDEGVRIVLQWNEPFDTANGTNNNPGNAGPGALTDYDFYLLDAPSATANVLASSADAQGCSSGDPLDPNFDPLESDAYENTTGSIQTVYLVIDRFCTAPGEPGEHLRVVTHGFGNSITRPDFEPSIFTDMQTFGHGTGDGPVAVAAIDFCEVDLAGGFSGAGGFYDVEAFSALGGDVPFYFTSAGSPIPGGPELRAKPEITAPDGTNTTFFGGNHGVGCGENDGFPNFFGTSAAAPHAAAVVALMLELSPGLTPADVIAALQANALDIENAGPDDRSGAGLIMAADTLAALPGLECNGLAATVIGTSSSETLTGGPGDDVIMALGGDDTIDGGGGDDTICGGTGNDVIDAGNGHDWVDGEGGSDTIDFGSAVNSMTVNLTLGTAVGQGNDDLFSIENILGSPQPDTLIGDSQDNEISGAEGGDVIKGRAGVDTLFGDGGPDDIQGGGAGDIIDGGDGGDTIAGQGGPDTIDGGASGDTIDGQGAADTIDGGAGADTIAGQNGADVIDGGGADDTIRGNTGPDTLSGGAGDDDLFGGEGADTLFGGDDTDKCSGNTGPDSAEAATCETTPSVETLF